MSGLMFFLAIAIAFAKDTTLRRMRTNTVRVKIWGGRILIVVGVWLIGLAIWADVFAKLLRS